MQKINIFIGQTWKRQTKVHILSILTHFSAHTIPNSTSRVLKHLNYGEWTSKQNKKQHYKVLKCSNPPFLEQPPPLYPVFKNLLWPKCSTPTFMKKKRGGVADCGPRYHMNFYYIFSLGHVFSRKWCQNIWSQSNAFFL